MIKVTQLGYLGVHTQDLAAVSQLLQQVCGLEVANAGKAIYARMDERHHRIAVYQSQTGSLGYLGLEVSSSHELALARTELEKRGYSVSVASAAECAERAVMEFISFVGPDGVRLELYCHASALAHPLRPGRPIEGFVAGDRGFGHVVLVSADPQRAEDFYREVFGFRVSDYIHFEGFELTFMHCNARHHSIAFIKECEGMQAGQLNHLMLETCSIDDVGRAYDIARQSGVPLVMELGKHSNDHTISFYMASAGFAVEYGYGGREIGPNWQVVRYDAAHVWGHEGARSAQVS